MKVLGALLFAAVAAAPAYARAAGAPTADVTAAFGNTLLTIDPDGRSRKLWLEPNGAWTGLSRRGHELAGKWKTEGDRVCLSQSKPALPGSLCQPWPASLKVGGPAVRDPSGKSGQLKLVEGRVTR